MLEYIKPSFKKAKYEIEDRVAFISSVSEYDIDIVINGVNYTIPVKWDSEDSYL